MPLKLITAFAPQCCYSFFVYIARQKRLGRRGTTCCSWLHHPQLIFKHVNASLKGWVFCFYLTKHAAYVKTQLLSWVTASFTCFFVWKDIDMGSLIWILLANSGSGQAECTTVCPGCVFGMCECLKILTFHLCALVPSHHKPPKVSRLYLIWLFKELSIDLIDSSKKSHWFMSSFIRIHC